MVSAVSLLFYEFCSVFSVIETPLKVLTKFKQKRREQVRENAGQLCPVKSDLLPAAASDLWKSNLY